MFLPIDLDSVSLVGWSDGGITSLVMAVFYPEVIDKLVLFGCNAYITEHDVSLIERKSYSPQTFNSASRYFVSY